MSCITLGTHLSSESLASSWISFWSSSETIAEIGASADFVDGDEDGEDFENHDGNGDPAGC